jgi:hypothetical protein
LPTGVSVEPGRPLRPNATETLARNTTVATLRSNMPVIAANEGEWQGTYTFVTPAGAVNDCYDFRIRLTISDDNAHAYRQESHYTWADGRTEDRVFEAAYDPASNRLAWDTGRIAGTLWEIDDTTFYLRFGFAQMPGVECHEMGQMFAGGARRGRTWLWYRDGALFQYVLIDERRTAWADGSPVRPD